MYKGGVEKGTHLLLALLWVPRGAAWPPRDRISPARCEARYHSAQCDPQSDLHTNVFNKHMRNEKNKMREINKIIPNKQTNKVKYAMGIINPQSNECGVHFLYL